MVFVFVIDVVGTVEGAVSLIVTLTAVETFIVVL